MTLAMTRSNLLLVAALAAATGSLLLPSRALAADPAGATGWKPLFNGTDLTGWYVFLRGIDRRNDDPNRLAQARDGVIHFFKDAEAGSQQPFGYLATEREYSNYHLRLEYRWGEKRFAPRANARRDSGLLYHLVNDFVWPHSVECQIQEQDTGDIYTIYTRLKSTVDPTTTNTSISVSTDQSTGIVRTNATARPVFLEPDQGGVPFVQGLEGRILRVIRNPLNEREGWNTVELIVRGDSATHIVNGKVNHRVSEIQDLVNGRWVPLTKGRIALQIEGAEILYRNIEIRELD